MAPRLSGQTSIFGIVFFVFESLLGIERQKKLKKFTILTRKPRSHVRILIYRTWPINIWPTQNGELGTSVVRKGSWLVHLKKEMVEKPVIFCGPHCHW